MARVELSETDERGSSSRGTRRKSDKERYSATQYDEANRAACGGSVRTTNGDAPKKAQLSKGTFERSENPKGA